MEVTMKIIYSPQVNNKKIAYQFIGEKVVVEFDGIVEDFDFTDMPDGMAEKITPETLPFNPIVEADKIDGVLYLRLINFIDEEATEEERFPEWMEV